MVVLPDCGCLGCSSALFHSVTTFSLHDVLSSRGGLKATGVGAARLVSSAADGPDGAEGPAACARVCVLGRGGSNGNSQPEDDDVRPGEKIGVGGEGRGKRG